MQVALRHSRNAHRLILNAVWGGRSRLVRPSSRRCVSQVRSCARTSTAFAPYWGVLTELAGSDPCLAFSPISMRVPTHPPPSGRGTWPSLGRAAGGGPASTTVGALLRPTRGAGGTAPGRGAVAAGAGARQVHVMVRGMGKRLRGGLTKAPVRAPSTHGAGDEDGGRG